MATATTPIRRKRTKPREVREYKAVPGSRLKDEDAAIIGRVIDGLSSANGAVTAETVVSEARRPTSPIHRYFEWDDDKAAMQHRLVQARHLLRSVRIVVRKVGSDEPITIRRAFVRVENDDGTVFLPAVKALSNAKYRAQILARALGELKDWQDRYRDLKELAGLFEAIDEALPVAKAA